MKINEKENGQKIPYEIMGTKVFFNDELMINLSKYERDFEQTIDVCVDENKCLAIGLAQSYVAQVIIPPRKYTEAVPAENTGEGMSETSGGIAPQSLPLDMDEVTLILWKYGGSNQ